MTKKGFSLLELVVVLAVMGTLAAVAVPVFSSVTDNSAVGALVSSADGIAKSANSRAQSDPLNPGRGTTINDIVLAASDVQDVELLAGDGATSGVRIYGQKDLCINVSITGNASGSVAGSGDPYECISGNPATTPTTAPPSSNSPTTPTTVVAQLVPLAPSITGVVTGNLSLTVNFTAESSSSRPVSSISARISADSYAPAPVTLGASASSASFTGLQEGVLYTIYVSSVNSAGESTSSTTGTAVVVPDQVSGVAVNLTGPTTATVSWSALPSTPAVPVEGYHVWVAPSGGTPALVGTSSSTSFALTGLTPGASYSYYVTAYNSSTEGAPSSSASLVVFTAPAAPAVSVSSLGNGSVTLGFSAPSATDAAPVTFYRVFLEGQQVTSLPSSSSSYTFTGLTPGQTYSMSVSAGNVSGVSSPTTVSQVVYDTPLVVTGLSALFDASSSSTANLAWSSLPDVSGYMVYKLGSSGIYVLDGTTGSATTYAATGLTPGTSYSFKVAAFNSSMIGPLSAAVTVTPGVFAPTLVSASAQVESVVLVWSHADRPSLDGYRVFHAATNVSVGGDVSPSPQGDGSFSTTISGLTMGTSYQFYMKAFADTRVSSASNTVSFTTTFTAPPAPVIYWAGVSPASKSASLVVVDGMVTSPLVSEDDDEVEDPRVCWAPHSRAVRYQVFTQNISANGVYQLSHVVEKPSSGWGSEACSDSLVFAELSEHGVKVTAVDSGARESVFSNQREVTKGRKALRGEISPAVPAQEAVAAVAEVPYQAAQAAIYRYHAAETAFSHYSCATGSLSGSTCSWTSVSGSATPTFRSQVSTSSATATAVYGTATGSESQSATATYSTSTGSESQSATPVYGTGTGSESMSAYANVRFHDGYSCPSGWTLDGSQCRRTYTFPVLTGYSCPGGWSLDGSQCRRTYTVSVHTGYSCPGGWSVDGSQCRRTYTYTVQTGTSYSCPNGGSLSGTQCNSTTTVQDGWSCPGGTSVSGSQCLSSNSAAATANYTTVRDAYNELLAAAIPEQAYVAPQAAIPYRAFQAAVIGVIRAKISNQYR